MRIYANMQISFLPFLAFSTIFGTFCIVIDLFLNYVTTISNDASMEIRKSIFFYLWRPTQNTKGQWVAMHPHVEQSDSMIDFSVVKNWWKLLVKYRNQDVIETGISKARVQNVQTYLEQLAASEW